MPNLSLIVDDLLRAHMKKIWKDTDQLGAKIVEMEGHVSQLDKPNTNTSSAVESFRKAIDKLENTLLSLMKEFRNELMEHNAQVQLELVRTVLEDFDKRVSRLHPLCSLSQSLPEIHSSHLKNLEIPLIHTTKWISPVFLCRLRSWQIT